MYRHCASNVTYDVQVQTAAAAWLGDTITDVVFAILVTLIAWQLWAGFAATGKAGHLFIVSNSIFLCRSASMHSRVAFKMCLSKPCQNLHPIQASVPEAHCDCRRLMVFWPNSPRKARFRTGLMVALRIQVMLVAYRIDAVLEGPNMAVPASVRHLRTHVHFDMHHVSMHDTRTCKVMASC